MKYFTRELLDRLNSQSQEESVYDEWEDQQAKYLEYVNQTDFPQNVLDFIHDFNLHDSCVLEISKPPRWVESCSVKGPRKFSILLPSGEGQTKIEYTLTSKIKLTKDNKLTTIFRTGLFLLWDGEKLTSYKPEMRWLYDEFAKEETGFMHNILFSNGYELSIPFSEFKVDIIPVAKEFVYHFSL